MSKDIGELQSSMVSMIEGADPELLLKGYETANDPKAFMTLDGAMHPTGEWRRPHVTVSVHGEFIEWLSARDMLSYTRTYEGDTQVIRDPSFVLGGLIAALEKINNNTRQTPTDPHEQSAPREFDPMVVEDNRGFTPKYDLEPEDVFEANSFYDS